MFYWVINSLPPVCSHAIQTILMVWVRITLGFQPRVIRTQTINIFSYCMNRQGITNSVSGCKMWCRTSAQRPCTQMQSIYQVWGNLKHFFRCLSDKILPVFKVTLKGHWTRIKSSPNFFQKKVGIFVPLEVLAWVMIACWVSCFRLTYFCRNMNISSIFYFLKSTSINTVAYGTLWKWCCSQSTS